MAERLSQVAKLTREKAAEVDRERAEREQREAAAEKARVTAGKRTVVSDNDDPNGTHLAGSSGAAGGGQDAPVSEPARSSTRTQTSRASRG